MNFHLTAVFLSVLFLGTSIFSQAPGSSVTITKNYRGEYFLSGVVASAEVKEAMERMAIGQLGKNVKISLGVSKGTPDFGADWKQQFLVKLAEIKQAREHKAIEFDHGVKVNNTLPDPVADADVLMLGDDTPLKLREMANGNTLVILFEGWCGPCRGQADDLMKINAELESNGINVILLSTEDDPDSKVFMTDVMREEGYKFKLGWTSAKVSRFFLGYTGFAGIPQVFMLSDMKIVDSFAGGGPRADKALRAALNKHWGVKLEQ